MAYYAVPEGGNYAVYQVGGGRVSTTSAAGLPSFGLSPSNLGSSSGATPAATPAPSPTPTPSRTYSPPTTNLQPGSSNTTAVKQLQDWLVSQGYMTQAQVNTGYGAYGPQTTAAVQKYQQDHGVDNSTGPGYWGPRTIAAATGQPVQSVVRSQPQQPAQPAQPATPPAPAQDQWAPIINSDPFTKELLSDPAKKATFDALPDTMKSTFLQTAGSLSKAVEAGKVVNPTITITPEQLKQFYDQATSEIDPYYKEQFDSLRGGLDLSLGRMTEDFTKMMTREADPFKQALDAQAENEAQAGTAFSSERVRRENTAVTNENNALTDAFTTTQRNAQDLLRGYESKVGTDKARSVALPTLSTYTATNKGLVPGTYRAIDPSLLGGISYGSVGADRETAARTRASQLETSYRQNRILDYSPLQ